MGLDQVAYATKEGEDRIDIQRWRKHPNLQGFMEQLWGDKGQPLPEGVELDNSPMGDFNCIPLSLTLGDIDELEDCVKNCKLPTTGGFFFGTSRASDKGLDEDFIREARKLLIDGWEVYYDSWW